MAATTSASYPCPACGRPMIAGLLAGLCPACLMAQGTATDESSASSRTGRFEPPPLEEVARLFPQLEILGLLGAGGMGAVFKARQPSLDRLVALKVLPSAGKDDHFTERFQREARALARLNHPHIVSVYEFGEAGPFRYFIMEFVDGANLRQLTKARRLAPREALQLVPQICDALQFAHDEGVVHRDIKPENVLVDRRGRVKIADFGLAKLIAPDPESQRLTRDDQVMGTPHYMAPEQIERPLDVDHRADIYSLGVVLYELLTGELPLGKFAPPSRKAAVDLRLDDVVMRALENDPDQRFQRASEVKTQVESIEAAETGVTSGQGLGHNRSSFRWRPWAIGLAAVVVTAMGVAVTRWNRLTPKPEKPAMVTQSARRDPATGLLAARLPGQGVVELLAVGHVGGGPTQWWRPDGTPENAATYELTAPAESRELGRVSKDLIFRVEDLPAGTDGPFFDAFPAAGVGYGGQVTRAGQRLRGLVQARFAWPPDVRWADVRVGFALLPWRTLATQPVGKKSGGTRHPQPGDPGWRLTFHPPVENEQGQLQVSVVFGPPDKGWSHRLVAVDAAGRRHPAKEGRGSPIESVMFWTFTFDDIALPEAASFAFEVRPIYWVGFDGVALEPSLPLPPSPPPRLAAEESVVVSELFDFDTGREAEFPAGRSAPDFLDDLDAHWLWIEAGGWDVASGPEGLTPLGMEIEELPADAWTTWSAADVTGFRKEAPAARRATTRLRAGGPRTYWYRTREGGSGLMQLEAGADRPSGVRLQLKRVMK